MLDWLLDRPLLLVVSGIAVGIGLLVWVDRSENAYKAQLLARAHTYADTLAVERIMAERAIGFGVGRVAGSAASRPR